MGGTREFGPLLCGACIVRCHWYAIKEASDFSIVSIELNKASTDYFLDNEPALDASTRRVITRHSPRAKPHPCTRWRVRLSKSGRLGGYRNRFVYSHNVSEVFREASDIHFTSPARAPIRLIPERFVSQCKS
eukprot:scaffold36735_cov183-Amphora_coffeaeformis.AAC.4